MGRIDHSVKGRKRSLGPPTPGSWGMVPSCALGRGRKVDAGGGVCPQVCFVGVGMKALGFRVPNGPLSLGFGAPPPCSVLPLVLTGITSVAVCLLALSSLPSPFRAPSPTQASSVDPQC